MPATGALPMHSIVALARYEYLAWNFREHAIFVSLKKLNPIYVQIQKLKCPPVLICYADIQIPRIDFSNFQHQAMLYTKFGHQGIMFRAQIVE